MIKDVCIFCGSNYGRGDEYTKGARSLVRELARYHPSLVFGGARLGLMKTVADEARAVGLDVIGVIPRFLADRGVSYSDGIELRIVDTIEDRKRAMLELTDTFVVLPGGLGTFQELFEIWTAIQLGEKLKLGLLNVSGFFDGVVGFLDHAISQGFMKVQDKSLVVIEENAAELLRKLDSFTPQWSPKWQIS